MMKYIGKIMDDNKIDSGLSEQEKHALEGSPIMQKYKAEDLDERTIFLAATYCDAKTLMIMEKNGVDFNITNARGETPLDAAAMFNPDSKAVKYLAGKCKLITYDSSHVERNCLSYAVYGEYEENIHTLWTKNVKWSEDMFGDYSAWITPAAIKIAEKYGAGFSPKTDIAPAFGYLNDAYLNSVMRAIVKEDELAVDAMNACIEAGNKDTAAKLFEAEGAINGDIVEYAIRAGFGDLAAKMISRHPECISQNGRKIMEAAIETGELKVAEAAIETGNVKVNEVNDSEKYGCTLLHVACRNPSSEMIELFRQHGADFSLEDSEGKKAKEIARETGFVNVINAVK